MARKRTRGKIWNITLKRESFIVWALMGASLASCCPASLQKRPLPTRPALEAVSVQNCKVVSGIRWCEVTIEPVLLNDENLKTHIIKLNAEPVWIHPAK